MDREDGWIRHRFAPGKETTVYTADICAEVGHEHCTGERRSVPSWLCCGLGLRRYHRHYPCRLANVDLL